MEYLMSATLDDQTQLPDPITPGSEELAYRYQVDRLWSGGSYGNMSCFARTDRLSNLDGFWHAATNDWMCGRIDLELEAEGKRLAPGETIFYPSHQTTTFAGRGVQAEKSVFVPYGSAVSGGEESSFYTVLKLRATEPITMRISCDIRWPATLTTNHTKQPERDHIQRRVRQWTEGSSVWAQTLPARVDRWDAELGDANEVRALIVPEGAAITFSEPGRARVRYTLELMPGEEKVFPLVLVAGTDGLDSLRHRVKQLPSWRQALDRTVEAYGEMLSRALVLTPDARINRGLKWAKANTVRVQHRYRKGTAFTNDPPQDIVVIRDCAWYGFGADWLTPNFTEAMFGMILEHGIHEGGKLTEYIHADTGEHEDYALNINDDTPLFIMAALHHYTVSANSSGFLRSIYPAVQEACDWILSQRRDGLVWCTVRGVDIWGNATWRNIIPGYNLAGAVTEINALCYAALNAGAGLAQAANHPSDSARWLDAAQELRAAIDSRLATGDGLYLLNRDAGGANATRTADLVFLLLGDVADSDSARRILDLLYSSPFYTPYGIHTVAQDEAEYHPNFGHGLMGGLWPNLTAWVAYAGRKIYPDRLAEMMSAVYALCEMEDPIAEGHVVPGEFPEWFDGETWKSKGMAMSPWMPPTYLWLGVEGLAGVAPTPDSLAVDPNLPGDWDWLIARDLPYRGELFSFFVYSGQLHSTHPVQSELPRILYNRDLTAELEVEGDLFAVALEDSAGISVLVAASKEAGIEGAVRFRGRTQHVSLAAGKAELLRWDLS